MGRMPALDRDGHVLYSSVPFAVTATGLVSLYLIGYEESVYIYLMNMYWISWKGRLIARGINQSIKSNSRGGCRLFSHDIHVNNFSLSVGSILP